MRIRFNSLKTRLIVTMLLMVVLPTITIGWVVYNKMSEYIRSDRISDVGRVADAKHEQLVMVLTRANSRAELFLSSLNKQCGGNSAKLNYICASHLIDAYLAAEGAIGANLHRKGDGVSLTIGTSAVQHEESIAYQTGQLAMFSSPGPKSDHSYFVSVAEESTGLQLSITYPSSVLEPVFNPPPADLGLTGETFLADGEGYFATRPRYASTQGYNLPISTHSIESCLSGQNREVLDLDYRGVAIIHGFRFIPEFGSACIMAHITLDEAFAPLKLLKQKLIFAIFLFCVILIITIIYLARSIVKPIAHLTKVARAIAAGDYQAQAEEAGSDESLALASSFNLMTNRLIQSEKMLKEAQQLAHIGSWERNLITGSFTCSEEIFRILEIAPPHKDTSYEALILTIHPEDREMVDRAYMACIQAREPFDIVLRLLFADGRVKWVNEHGNFYYDANGVPLRSIGTMQDITKRKQAETLEQRFGQLLQSSFNEIYLFDASTLYFIQASEGAKRNLGYSTDELEQLTPLDIKPSFTRESFEQMIAPLRSGEQQSLHYETVHRRKDGTTYPVEVNLQLLTTTTTTTTFLIVAQNITERKQMEEELRRSETKFRTLYESSGDAIMLLDEKGFFDCNKATMRVFGCTARDDFINKYPFQFSPPTQPGGRDSMSMAGEHIATAFKNGSDRFEWMHRRLDGTEFSAEVWLVSMELDGRQVLQATVRDITERKRLENALRKSEDQFRSTFNQAAVGIAHASLGGSFQLVNEKFCEIVGYSYDELIHMRFQDITFPADLEDNLCYFQQLLAGEISTFTMEKRYVCKDRNLIWVNLTVSMVRDADGTPKYTIGVIEDITARKQAEDKLRKYSDELETINQQLHDTQNLLLQSDKMASVGQLAAGVAHEINNPIGYVGSNLGTLDEYLKELFGLVAAYEEMENAVADDAALARVKAAKNKMDMEFLKEDVLSLMRESQEGIIRVKKIVQDLKDFSRVDSGDEWHYADLHKGLDSTLNVASNEIKYKANVKKEYGDIAEVECVISQLNQVFMNLLVNAAHAIDERGTITLRTGQQGDEVWVEVADTGKGIAPEHLNKIFDPFFTTKPVGKGTGLGLSLSYGIIQKHHGRIEVNSEVGKGTSFKVWLPVNQPQDDDTPVGEPTFGSGSGFHKD